MNRLFLSPEVSGMQNLLELVELKMEKKLAVIFISNHINCNDPFVETAFLPDILKEKIFPIIFLTAHEKFGGFLKSSIMKSLGCIPVANGKGQNIREVLRRIKDGESAYLFPEAKMSSDGEMDRDQGALQLFSKFSDVIVQPIHITGLGYGWDLLKMFLRKRKVHVVFGQPFVLSKGSTVDAMEIIKERCVKTH